MGRQETWDMQGSAPGPPALYEAHEVTYFEIIQLETWPTTPCRAVQTRIESVEVWRGRKKQKVKREGKKLVGEILLTFYEMS